MPIRRHSSITGAQLRLGPVRLSQVSELFAAINHPLSIAGGLEGRFGHVTLTSLASLGGGDTVKHDDLTADQD